MEKTMKSKIVDAIKTFGYYLASGGKRRKPDDIKMIVVHATAGGSFSGAWATLKERKLGYHAILPAEKESNHGNIIKCVPDTIICGHAGNSYGPIEASKGISRKQDKSSNFIAKTSVNKYTLGISFVNLNDGKDPYSREQTQACIDRCVSWALAYPTIEWITTHYFVAPRRKTDPLGFDIENLVRQVNSLIEGKRSPLKLWKP